MFFDPMYFLVVGPGMALALWASFRVKSTFRKFSTVGASSGLSGADVAREMLRRHNILDVRVEESDGFLSDHYDPQQRVVRLSSDVYHGHSLASIGVAAHECGHVLQDAANYAPMRVRQGLVGPANFGSSMSYVLIFLGMLLNFSGLVWLGILAFSTIVLFQLVTLPVEFDASSRARRQLVSTGIVTQAEDAGVGRVLNAAALTYVAALITSLLTLAYYLMRFTGGRNDD